MKINFNDEKFYDINLYNKNVFSLVHIIFEILIKVHDEEIEILEVEILEEIEVKIENY